MTTAGVRDEQPAVAKPFWVAVEGPIAAGKTALVSRLAGLLFARPFLDPVPGNPHLDNLHVGRTMLADSPMPIRTELLVLALRVGRLREVRDHLTGGGCALTDWTMAKSAAYAAAALDPADRQRLADTQAMWTDGAPPPDVVIHLKAGAGTVAARIRDRGRPAEIHLRPADLAARATALTQALATCGSPLLAVTAATLDLDDDAAVRALADRVKAALDPPPAHTGGRVLVPAASAHAPNRRRT